MYYKLKIKNCSSTSFVSENNIWDITYYILLYHKKHFLKVWWIYLTEKDINPLMHNVPKWSDTQILQQMCLTILGDPLKFKHK